MKKFLLIATFLWTCSNIWAAEDGIVFVDLEQVFSDFYKTKLAQGKMEAQTKDVEAERLVMVNEMNVISEEVDQLRKEARDVTLSQEIRDGKRILYEERLLELRDKEKEITEFIERRKKQSQMQISRMSQTIMDEIRTTVVDYAQKEGLKAVIDNSTRRAAVGVFIYTHPSVDITPIILSILNSQQPDLEQDLLAGDGAGEGSVGETTTEEENETE